MTATTTEALAAHCPIPGCRERWSVYRAGNRRAPEGFVKVKCRGCRSEWYAVATSAVLGLPIRDFDTADPAGKPVAG